MIANWVSRYFKKAFISFCSWLDSLIWTGCKRELKQEDLYATPDNCRSQKLLKEFKRCVCQHMYMYNCMCMYVCVYACV